MVAGVDAVEVKNGAVRVVLDVPVVVLVHNVQWPAIQPIELSEADQQLIEQATCGAVGLSITVGIQRQQSQQLESKDEEEVSRKARNKIICYDDDDCGCAGCCGDGWILWSGGCQVWSVWWTKLSSSVCL